MGFSLINLKKVLKIKGNVYNKTRMRTSIKVNIMYVTVMLILFFCLQWSFQTTCHPSIIYVKKTSINSDQGIYCEPLVVVLVHSNSRKFTLLLIVNIYFLPFSKFTLLSVYEHFFTKLNSNT